MRERDKQTSRHERQADKKGKQTERQADRKDREGERLVMLDSAIGEARKKC